MTSTPARAQARINHLFRELDLIGCYTDDMHVTEYDGDTYTTPSLIDHDDGKENDTSGLVQG